MIASLAEWDDPMSSPRTINRGAADWPAGEAAVTSRSMDNNRCSFMGNTRLWMLRHFGTARDREIFGENRFSFGPSVNRSILRELNTPIGITVARKFSYRTAGYRSLSRSHAGAL